jgi:hypothetical protein
MIGNRQLKVDFVLLSKAEAEHGEFRLAAGRATPRCRFFSEAKLPSNPSDIDGIVGRSPFCTVLCDAVQCGAVQCSTLQYAHMARKGVRLHPQPWSAAFGLCPPTKSTRVHQLNARHPGGARIVCESHGPIREEDRPWEAVAAQKGSGYRLTIRLGSQRCPLTAVTSRARPLGCSPSAAHCSCTNPPLPCVVRTRDAKDFLSDNAEPIHQTISFWSSRKRSYSLAEESVRSASRGGREEASPCSVWATGVLAGDEG